jgi:hypothetical protein
MLIFVLFQQNKLVLFFDPDLSAHCVYSRLKRLANCHPRAVDGVIKHSSKEEGSLVVQFLDLLDTDHMLDPLVEKYLSGLF